MNFYAVMGASMVPDLRVISDTPQLSEETDSTLFFEELVPRCYIIRLSSAAYLHVYIYIKISLCE